MGFHCEGHHHCDNCGACLEPCDMSHTRFFYANKRFCRRRPACEDAYVVEILKRQMTADLEREMEFEEYREKIRENL